MYQTVDTLHAPHAPHAPLQSDGHQCPSTGLQASLLNFSFRQHRKKKQQPLACVPVVKP